MKLRLLALLLSLLAAPLHAAEAISLEGCMDYRGRAVAIQTDSGMPLLVQTVANGNEVVIRHNPDVLQKLSPEVRAFFLAQACARHALGLAGLAFLSPSQAQRADCAGLNTLLASGLLSDGEVAGLQQQLVFTADDWKQLPGPARMINLGNCQRRGNVLKLPLPQTPSARQTAWDQCVHACGDKLWHCQNRCRAGACDACVADYSTCQAACGEAPALPPLTGG